MYRRLTQNPNFTFWELSKAEDLLVENQSVTGAIIDKNGQPVRVMAGMWWWRQGAAEPSG